MAFTPSAGLNCVLTLSTGTVLAGTNWTINADPKPAEVSNFVTGRLKVPTLLDATLTFQLIWDTANPPVSGGSTPPSSGAGSYWAGNYVTVYAYVDKVGGKFFTFAGLISRVTPSIASIEEAMRYDVEVSLSQTPPSNTFSQQAQFVYPS